MTDMKSKSGAALRTYSSAKRRRTTTVTSSSKAGAKDVYPRKKRLDLSPDEVEQFRALQRRIDAEIAAGD